MVALALAPVAFHDGHAVLLTDPTLRAERAIHRALDAAMLMSLRRRSRDEDRRARDLDTLIRESYVETLYQPIMDLLDLTVVGHEVFSRGPVGSPFEDAEALFLLAERTGRLIAERGKRELDQVVLQIYISSPGRYAVTVRSCILARVGGISLHGFGPAIPL